MRIQARLFLGTAALVLALMGIQWWLHARQLRALEHELGQVATSVSKELLTGEMHFAVERFFTVADGADEGDEAKLTWVASVDSCVDEVSEGVGEEVACEEEKEKRVEIMVVPGPGAGHLSHEVRRIVRNDGHEVVTTEELVVHGAGGPDSPSMAVDLVAPKMVVKQLEEGEDGLHRTLAELPEGVRKMEIRVVQEENQTDRLLIVRADSGLESRIPIPVAPTVDVVNRTLRQGLAFGSALLVVGLVASGVMARRVARPLQDLAASAEALGNGELGARVHETAAGEVGELQCAFNRMSQRLTDLETEREQWRRREHLAQLGDLSRGLAHTLRNPLHTLGLAVEELAREPSEPADLVGTARSQIRRIDRWLRSFLALGAGDAAEITEVDLGALVQDAALEVVQQGVTVDVQVPENGVPAAVVETAVRAALANLLENAAEVSPAGEAVRVELEQEDGAAMIRIADRGPGLPAEVRQRLYSPHVTTKAEGSGMGLFLARQLVVEMHGGDLGLVDREGGGTVATLRIPLRSSDPSPEAIE